MAGRRRLQARLGASAVLGVLLVGWLFFAPPQLGGPASYAVVRGSSMAPILEDGDLAVVHGQDRYRVGDVVLYRDAVLGQSLLHRVVGRAGDRFVMKGDHNRFLDAFRPKEDEVVGRLWLRIPNVGRAIGWLRRPAHAALVAGLLAAILAGGRSAARRRIRPPAGQTAVAGLVLAFAASLALGLVAFSQPAARTASAELYRHTGKFGYSAAAEKGTAVYGRRVATTGQPVFLRLSRTLSVRFGYELRTSAPSDVTGRARLRVGLRSADGWSRTVLVTRWRPFDGTQARLTGRVDLGRVQRLLTRVQALTGIHSGSYTLTVAPDVRVDGVVAGRQVRDSFSPSLPLRLDALELSLASTEARRLLAPRKAGLVTVREPGTLSLLVLEVETATARRAAVAVGILSLLGLGVFGLVALGVVGGEEARIRARYGRLIVPVAHEPRDPDVVAHGLRPPQPRLPTIDVDSFDALARLAEHGGRMILHAERDGRDEYLVADGGFLYRYRAAEAPVVAPVEEAAADEPLMHERTAT